jgi:hypothetical protein
MAIIGDPFEDYVKQQIHYRQSALGMGVNAGGGRSLNTQKIFNSNSPWIRLASAVNITKGNDKVAGKSVQQQIKDIGIFDGLDKEILEGDALSKNFVLMGTPTNNLGSNQPSGIISKGDALLGAYGYGYSQLEAKDKRGYVPPPGIVDASFDYKNDGALAFATINIKAFSEVQFSIIDILFQRPGYTCLLEFGHTIFLDKEGEMKRAGDDVSYNTSPFDFIFKPPGKDVSYTQLSNKISEEKVKWDGNYDGFFGIISKFNWKFNNDGSYDITVKLTGTGDVISSLKSNGPKLKSNIPLSFSGSPSTSPSDDDVKKAIENGNSLISKAVGSQLNFELWSIFSDSGTFSAPESTSGSDIKVSDIIIKEVPIKGKLKDISFTKAVAKVDPKDWFGLNQYSPVTSIKFGVFLSILQKICNIKDNNGNYYLNFSMVEDLSTNDPKEDDTYMVTYPGHFSSDPTKAFIKYFAFDKEIAPGKDGEGQFLPFTTINDKLHRTSNDEDVENPLLVMRLSDVYVDLNFITTLLEDLVGNDKENTNTSEIPILTLLKSILSGINNVLGGVNDFRVRFNEVTHQIDIISESPILNKKSSTDDEFAIINTFGLSQGEGSFVENMDLNSELTDAMATQISIGAQNNSNQHNGGASAFSTYSKGLVDRLFPQKLDANDKKEQEYETLPDRISEIYSDEVQKAFKSIYDDRRFNKDFSQVLQSPLGTVSSIVLNRYKQFNKSATPSFLPFNLSLTMHGLSGMKIYNAFQIQGRGLPINYDPSSIKLIIKSLSHTIDSNGWKTKISTLSAPLEKNLNTSHTPVTTPSPNYPSTNKSCQEKFGNEKYSVIYLNLKKLKYRGSDPRSGLNLQGIPLVAFPKLMVSSGDGKQLPKAGYGVARKAFEDLQTIGNEALKIGLTGFTINSHYRSPVYNCSVGGAKNSMHKTGGAIDIGTPQPQKLYNLIVKLIANKKISQGGVGLYNSFVHYDIRGTYARWDNT